MANLNDVERDPIDNMYLSIMEILKEKHKERRLLLPKDVKRIVDTAYHECSVDEDLFDEEEELNLETDE